MQFTFTSTKALASALLLSSLAVALPATKEGSVSLPGGDVVRITSVLNAKGNETCNPMECSCKDEAAGVIQCVVPLGGDKTQCSAICTGVNRQT
ncbi:hypothetical protein PG993_002891 [Apiospora rasikravindrae]|uniref:Uncharacterized protein n=1 Tax=Apiospora rasikravindrae TaxID=990691 RepID=A0ABR1TXZ1_9PEZI